MDDGLLKRFYKKVDTTGDCWLWTAYRNGKGYGQFQDGKKKYPAHRFSWIITNGEIQEDLFVLHKCDNPPCVNPSHLFLGTQGENMHDMKNKGRQSHNVGEKAGNCKLKQEQVDEIRRTYQRGTNGEFSNRGLAKKFGLGSAQISRIVTNKRWDINGSGAITNEKVGSAMNIENSVKYIEENLLDNDFCLKQVADKFRMSPWYYSRMFKVQMGIGFRDYVINKRTV